MADITLHTEKDLENWIAEHIGGVMEDEDAFVIGQQLRLPNGQVLDILAGCWETRANGLHDDCAQKGVLHLTIIEVKRDRIDLPSVTQLLTYMGALDVAVHLAGAPQTDNDYRKSFEIQGLLAAPSISADACLAVKMLGNVGYVHLKTHVQAERWYTFGHPTCDQEDAEDLADTLRIEHGTAWYTFNQSAVRDHEARASRAILPEEGQLNVETDIFQPA